MNELQKRTLALTGQDPETIDIDREWLQDIINRCTLGEMRTRFARHMLVDGEELSEPDACAEPETPADDDDGAELF